MLEVVGFPFVLISLVGWALPWCWFSRWLRRGKKPRIIWGPTPIINIATNAAADRCHGYQSDTLVFETYSVSDEFTYNLTPLFAHRSLSLLLPWFVFLWTTSRYEIFQHYFHGGFLRHTLLRRWEWVLLRILGKKVIVSAYGSDVRDEKATRALGPFHCCLDCTQRLRACVCDESHRRARVARATKWAHVTLSMGDMSEYTPGSRNDFFYWAIDLERWKYEGVRPSAERVRVVHAPNHPEFKGTRYLERAVEELQSRGMAIDLQLVTGLPNAEAREIYREADIIVDQLLIGWHGNFSVEAMALGKPVICYIRKPQEYLPKWAECPIVSATPDTIAEVLEALVGDPERRVALGRAGRRFVEQVYAQDRVGQRMTSLYRELCPHS